MNSQAAPGLLKNPGFEEGSIQELPTGWKATADSAQKATFSEKSPHGGQRSLAIPAQSAVEQLVENVPAGAYLASCWVKSEAAQKVTIVLSNPARPWAVYNCAEISVPQGEWTRIESFCNLDRDGNLAVLIGGVSQEYRSYHGDEAEMKAPILVDDCELVRYEPKSVPSVSFWDATADGALTLPINGKLIAADSSSASFSQSAVFQAGQIYGAVLKASGGLSLYTSDGKSLSPRGVLAPSPAFKVSQITPAKAAGRTGLKLASEDGKQYYTVWISPRGVVTVEPGKVSLFAVNGSRMSYGLLPSFVGSDICYTPASMAGVTKAAIPSTQWYVGLVEGGESMLTAVWDSPDQAVTARLSGTGAGRVIDSLEIDSSKGGFSLSYTEHSGLWHRETLKEDYLGDYTPIAWEKPFPARWMAHFFCSPGGKPSFHSPYNGYSFPIANSKTRMWGVWFEDWNHYPFYFDGAKTIAHFEKSFAPAGDALIYFLEPAAADLVSPCETVVQALGAERAAALFDFDGNGLRRLKYSTPALFMYDRPVCATTTRLSKIKKEDKATTGVNLATHLYEFIREIRGRVDQYSAYFGETKDYLAAEATAHPDLKPYLAPMEALVTEAQSRSKKAYETPLPAVQAKIEVMKKQLEEGGGDGYNCGNLDVRGPAGEQDDLCRRYNRLVLRLVETAMLNCEDSPEKAAVAKHLWEKSRAVLREPTRWEPRRTLYFFEP